MASENIVGDNDEEHFINEISDRDGQDATEDSLIGEAVLLLNTHQPQVFPTDQVKEIFFYIRNKILIF